MGEANLVNRCLKVVFFRNARGALEGVFIIDPARVHAVYIRASVPYYVAHLQQHGFLKREKNEPVHVDAMLCVLPS